MSNPAPGSTTPPEPWLRAHKLQAAAIAATLVVGATAAAIQLTRHTSQPAVHADHGVVGNGTVYNGAVYNGSPPASGASSYLDLSAVHAHSNRLDISMGAAHIGRMDYAESISTSSESYFGLVLEVKNPATRAVLMDPTLVVRLPHWLRPVVDSGTLVTGQGNFPLSGGTFEVGSGQNLPNLSPQAVVYVRFRLLATARPPCGRETNATIQAVISAQGAKAVRPKDVDVSILGRC